MGPQICRGVTPGPLQVVLPSSGEKWVQSVWSQGENLPGLRSEMEGRMPVTAPFVGCCCALQVLYPFFPRWSMALCVVQRLWPSVSGASAWRLAVTMWWTHLRSWTNVGCVGAKAPHAGRSPGTSHPLGEFPSSNTEAEEHKGLRTLITQVWIMAATSEFCLLDKLCNCSELLFVYRMSVVIYIPQSL
jgi:hypothetical protein